MRKEKAYTVTDEGRDKGKIFLLREMGADRAEKWAMRALSAAARSGVDLGEVPTGGMAGIAVVGIQSLFQVSFDEAEPLMDELFTCVRIVRDARHPEMAFDLMEDDVEEIATRMKLRMEVLKLHLGFFPSEKASSSTSETPPKTPHSSSTPTSRPSSGQRSRITRPR